MSYIPNVREKMTTPLTAKSVSKPNAYWQGYLNDEDAEFVAGFDWAITIVARLFFDNLDIYEGGTPDIGVEDINLSLPEYFEKHPDKLNVFRSCLFDYAEAERNELVVSMLDDMGEEEYNKRKADVDNGAVECALFLMRFEEDIINDGFAVGQEN